MKYKLQECANEKENKRTKKNKSKQTSERKKNK